jgi:hypothetical protein
MVDVVSDEYESDYQLSPTTQAAGRSTVARCARHPACIPAPGAASAATAWP